MSVHICFPTCLKCYFSRPSAHFRGLNKNNCGIKMRKCEINHASDVCFSNKPAAVFGLNKLPSGAKMHYAGEDGREAIKIYCCLHRGEGVLARPAAERRPVRPRIRRLRSARVIGASQSPGQAPVVCVSITFFSRFSARVVSAVGPDNTPLFRRGAAGDFFGSRTPCDIDGRRMKRSTTLKYRSFRPLCCRPNFKRRL